MTRQRRARAQHACRGQAIGHDGEPQVARRQRIGEQRRRRSAIDHQRVALGDHRRRRRADATALGGAGSAPLADAGLVGQRTAGAAAVGPVQRAASCQVVEIAARGLGGHVEGLGQRRDAHGALAPQQRQHLRVPRLLRQPLPGSSHATFACPSGEVGEATGVGGEIEERVAIAQEARVADGARIEIRCDTDLSRCPRACRRAPSRRRGLPT